MDRARSATWRRALLLIWAVLFCIPLTASARPVADWPELVTYATQRFTELDSGHETAHAYSYMAGTMAHLYGWHDARALDYLQRVYELEQPNGGYGLGFALDLWSDGHPSPPDTTYTITLADHVGRIFLEGYDAGVVPRRRVQGLIDVLLSQPRTSDERGVCIGYSDYNPECVYNVDAAAGWFLWQVQQRGFSVPAGIIAGITRRVSAGWDDGWPYREGGDDGQNVNYNAVTAVFMEPLDPTLARQAEDAVRRQPLRDWYGPLGLLGMGDCTGSTYAGVATMLVRSDARYMAQIAYLASRC